jgi:hypothetical protein
MGSESSVSGVRSSGFCVGCFAIICSAFWIRVGASGLSSSPEDSATSVLHPDLLFEYLPQYHILVAFLATFLCCAGAVWIGSGFRFGGKSTGRRSWSRKRVDVGISNKISGSGTMSNTYPLAANSTAATNGTGNLQYLEKYSSMVEDLVPEITQHALSYLDYKSLCQVSKTNSAMRRVADDDSAWRALYRKVCFPLQQFIC